MNKATANPFYNFITGGIHYCAGKRPLLPHWDYMLFSGVTALLFAAFSLAFWPETEHWLLGLLLGINMIMLGGSMVKMSLRYKDNY